MTEVAATLVTSEIKIGVMTIDGHPHRDGIARGMIIDQAFRVPDLAQTEDQDLRIPAVLHPRCQLLMMKKHLFLYLEEIHGTFPTFNS